jgi:PiT family inorganic phosphate transporter
MEYGLIFIIIACTVGLLMTWGIGANDLANIVSPGLGAKAITVRQAMFIAVVFEIAGAFFGGTQVTETIRGGIIDSQLLAHTPQLLIYAMLSVLLAGAVWINVASYMGMPVSITNAVIGALVGVGAIALGVHAVHWQTVGFIAISWISSPTIAGIISFLLFNSIRRSILGEEHPLEAAKRYVPIYLTIVGIVLAFMVVIKGFKHFSIHLSAWQTMLIVIFTTLVILLIGFIAMRNIFAKAKINRHMQFTYIEGMFSILMAFTACAMVFAHGSNDVAIAVGPIAGIISLVMSNGAGILLDGKIVSGMMFFGCVGVILGLFMYGRKVIATVGHSITTLTPSRAFAATLAAASAVVVSTSTGIPVSATQTLVGAVFGVGLARGIDALNLNVIRNIFLSWVITIPAAAALATGFFYGLRWVFG